MRPYIPWLSPSAILAVVLLATTTAYGQQRTHAVRHREPPNSQEPLNCVRVDTDQGAVRLTGSAPTLLAKDRAAHLAETVKGVTSVDNQLVVTPARPMDADDLESTILQGLIADPVTEGFNVTVEADPEGHVGLTGEVQSQAEKELVGLIAKSVIGVTKLSNRLDVNYERLRGDTDIEAEVESMLAWHAYIDSGLVDVSVRNGAVTLSGTVGSAEEKRRAAEMAWSAGSRSVNSDALKVAPRVSDDDRKRLKDAKQRDSEMADAVRQQLRADPRVAGMAKRFCGQG